MTTDRDAALLKIATDILDLETLETRMRDCLDFKEHGVFSIKRHLGCQAQAQPQEMMIQARHHERLTSR